MRLFGPPPLRLTSQSDRPVDLVEDLIRFFSAHENEHGLTQPVQQCAYFFGGQLRVSQS